MADALQEIPGAKPTTQLERLKAEREKATERREPLDLPLPGYSLLVARYRALTYEEIEKLLDKGRKMVKAHEPEFRLKITMDSLAKACVGMFTRTEAGDLLPVNELKEDYGDEPVLYDGRLADALGLEADTARAVIREAFPHDLAIFAHWEEVSSWMEDTAAEDDQDF